MKNVYEDNRIVMTLDAGGTNLVFSALQLGKEIISPIILPSYSENLEKCLKTIIEGFQKVKESLQPEIPVAISFAFPGPADYSNGIIGDLPNFPSFKDGIALGPMLEEIFEIPTLINNDGDLFAYGEAVAGFLPRINKALKEHGVERVYKNLLGITLGTGFGAGLVINNQICQGDNSAAGELWLTRNFLKNDVIAEESISIRAILRVYAEESRDYTATTPKDIYEIAKGIKEGDSKAAICAFEHMAVVLGEALANAITLIDGPIVIGGGISGAAEFIIPKAVEHLKSVIYDIEGNKYSRIIPEIFDLDNPEAFSAFVKNDENYVKVPFSSKKALYNREKRIAIGVTHLGTSEAIWLGAYALALDYLDNKTNQYASTSVK